MEDEALPKEKGGKKNWREYTGSTRGTRCSQRCKKMMCIREIHSGLHTIERLWESEEEDDDLKKRRMMMQKLYIMATLPFNCAEEREIQYEWSLCGSHRSILPSRKEVCTREVVVTISILLMRRITTGGAEVASFCYHLFSLFCLFWKAFWKKHQRIPSALKYSA